MQPIVEHRDFELNGALIKPERSLNSPPRPCCRKRPETRDRSRKKGREGGWVNFEEWCCQMGLNHRPLHYQWSALPLSYGSMRPKAESGPRGGSILATRAAGAQARALPCHARQKGRLQGGQPGRYASETRCFLPQSRAKNPSFSVGGRRCDTTRTTGGGNLERAHMMPAGNG